MMVLWYKQKTRDSEIWDLGHEQYLLCEGVHWSIVSVSLAVDGGFCTSTNGIHFPVSVVIVHHMEIAMPTPELFIIQFLVSSSETWFQIVHKLTWSKVSIHLPNMFHLLEFNNTLAFSEWVPLQNGCKQ